MPHYLSPSVVLSYDFIVTYQAIMFFIYWILARLRINRLSHVFPPSLGKKEQKD